MAFTYKRLNKPGTGSGNETSVPYISTFTAGSWTGPVSGEYSITVSQATHGKGTDPTVQVYEDVSGVFEQTTVSIELSATGDVTILVSETPDLRFQGKIIIL